MSDIQVKGRFEDKTATYFSFYSSGVYIYGKRKKGEKTVNVECQRFTHWHKELTKLINEEMTTLELKSVFLPREEVVKFYYDFSKLSRIFIDDCNDEEKRELMMNIYNSGLIVHLN